MQVIEYFIQFFESTEWQVLTLRVPHIAGAEDKNVPFVVFRAGISQVSGHLAPQAAVGNKVDGMVCYLVIKN